MDTTPGEWAQQLGLELSAHERGLLQAYGKHCKVTMEEKQDDLPLIGQIAKLKLEPGDVLVLSMRQYLSQAATARMRDICRQAVGTNRILILDAGVALSVFHPPDPPVGDDGGGAGACPDCAREGATHGSRGAAEGSTRAAHAPPEEN